MKTQSFFLFFFSLFSSCARRNLQAIRSNTMHNQEREREKEKKEIKISLPLSLLSDEPNLLEASNAFNDVVRHTSQTR